MPCSTRPGSKRISPIFEGPHWQSGRGPRTISIQRRSPRSGRTPWRQPPSRPRSSPISGAAL
ncbi:hypothetical protein TK43_07900 [Roseovarius sp. JS7-11]|nr:hypothetical protein TK43_07900 [Roseovarius sp. JS7-11]